MWGEALKARNGQNMRDVKVKVCGEEQAGVKGLNKDEDKGMKRWKVQKCLN